MEHKKWKVGKPWTEFSSCLESTLIRLFCSHHQRWNKVTIYGFKFYQSPIGKIKAILGISNSEHFIQEIGCIGMEELKSQRRDGETTQTFSLSWKLWALLGLEGPGAETVLPEPISHGCLGKLVPQEDCLAVAQTTETERTIFFLHAALILSPQMCYDLSSPE